MLQAYVPRGTQLERHEIPLTGTVPEEAVWLDLVNPAPGEDKMVEQLLGIAVPTREEMQEIEVSSRLYVEHHARFMTATLMCNSDTAVPKHTAVTFILAKHRLVTVRYEDPRPFTIVGNKLTRVCPKDVTGETVLISGERNLLAVRDLSQELGKKIELTMLGAETELDRQVLELIKDPLTHMVRNSGDHGLEGPAERRGAGKSETGRITLSGPGSNMPTTVLAPARKWIWCWREASAGSPWKSSTHRPWVGATYGLCVIMS